MYGAFLLVPVVWWMLEKTTLGLKIKSVGQNPAAADSVGISVDRIRYLSVCMGAMLAGIAGASLSISLLNLFQDNLTAGQGFIAVALVYFGGWSPVGVLGRSAPVQRGQLLPALGAGAGREDPVERRGHAALPPDHRRADGDGQPDAPARRAQQAVRAGRKLACLVHERGRRPRRKSPEMAVHAEGNERRVNMKGKRFLVAGLLIVLLAVGPRFAAPFRIAVVMPSAITDMAFSQSMWSALVGHPEGDGRTSRRSS